MFLSHMKNTPFEPPGKIPIIKKNFEESSEA